jgi:hypothetical protein
VDSARFHLEAIPVSAICRNPHFSQKTREMGHPTWEKIGVEVKINVKGNGQGLA